MKLGERIHAARIERAMSLSDLARATHLSKGFISQIESGRSNPSIESLAKLAEALNLAPGEFLSTHSVPIAKRSGISDSPIPFENGSQEIAVHSAEPATSMKGSQIVPIMAERGQGSAAIITIQPHSRMLAPQPEQPTRGTAICAVLQGAVTITRQGVVAVAGQGQVATFSANSSYEIANRSSARTTLLLTLPAGCSMPINIGSRATEARRPIYSSGPLRLVEMRASRGLTGDRGR